MWRREGVGSGLAGDLLVILEEGCGSFVILLGLCTGEPELSVLRCVALHFVFLDIDRICWLHLAFEARLSEEAMLLSRLPTTKGKEKTRRPRGIHCWHWKVCT
jgi:hypothetical protein